MKLDISDIDHNNLIKFAAEMYIYQDEINNKCQCADCTIVEPAPGKVIHEKLEKYFGGKEMELLQEYKNHIWWL